MKEKLKNYTLNLEMDIKALSPTQAFEKFERLLRKGLWRQDDICILYEDNVKTVSFSPSPKKGK